MRRGYNWQMMAWMPLLALGALLAIAVAMLLDTKSASAATVTPGVCRAVMIFDRSGSVGESGIATMKAQVRRLFEPTGLYDSKIELGFWSFSSGGSGALSYNTPGYGYVSSRGPMNTFFASRLNSMTSGGSTNYEQGFGYNNDVRNTTLGTTPDLADIIVFMTDGLPNVPGSGDGNSQAVSVARRAVLHYKDAGKVVLGGLVGTNVNAATLARVINGNASNRTNLFTISNNYSDLSEKLKAQIGTQCNELLPDPCPYNAALSEDDPNCLPPAAAYTLVPVATGDKAVISSNESAGFQYHVTNENRSNTSPSVPWSIKQVVVEREQSADPLFFGSDTYRDGYSCTALLGLIANNGTCEEVASGERQFTPGQTILSNAEVGSASRLVTDDRWPIGTKVCYVLSLPRPTQQASPTQRHSRAACVVIGKRPAVQVHGGDLRVGGLVPGDPEAVDVSRIKIQTSLTRKGEPANRVFGSWAEYGISAPGPIVGTASQSGLEGGHAASVGELQAQWSKLTFANQNDVFGEFSTTHTMADTAAALLNNQTPVNIDASNQLDAGSMNSGVYEKRLGNLTLQTSTLGRNKSIVVHVPNGTVTIAGNQNYSNGPYTQLSEIPRLVVIARAINIVGAVTNIDGWLIARNSPTSTGGGVISTCSDGPNALTIATCNQQLRVNGAVLARQLLLRRTAGSGIGADSAQPAEIFNLRADAYLSPVTRRSSMVIPMTTYSVELPPRF